MKKVITTYYHVYEVLPTGYEKYLGSKKTEEEAIKMVNRAKKTPRIYKAVDKEELVFDNDEEMRNYCYKVYAEERRAAAEINWNTTPWGIG